MRKETAELIMQMRKVRASGNDDLWFNVIARIYSDPAEDARKVGKRLIKEFRREMTARINGGRRRAESNRLLRSSYILTAPDNFEEFMIAMEWDRTPNARFWLPRRKVLEGKLGLATTIQNFIDDDSLKFLALSMPPASGKSTLIKFLCAYIAGKYPDSANMYVSYAKGMVDVMYSSLVSMLTDSEYNFSEIFPTAPTLKTSAEYSTLSYRSAGEPPTLGLVALGGSVTGRTRANKFFITDDLVRNDEVARSPERLETLWQDYTNTLTTRKIGEDCKEIMLGTIWSLHDPISRMKEKYAGRGDHIFIAYPVKDEEGHSNFNYEHPDRYTDEMIRDLEERLDPATFSALYMQQGIEKEGLAFTEDNLQFYNGTLPDGEPDDIFFWADVAWGGGDSFSMPIIYAYGDTWYCPDVIFDQGDKTVTKPRVVAKILHHHVMNGGFEANNGGAEYCDDITKMLKKENYSCHLVSKKAPNNVRKEVRIEQHQDAIRHIYFLDRQHREKEYDRFMRELQGFSFTGKNLHDDAPDSLAGVVEYKKGHTVLSTVEIRNRLF